MTTAKTPEEHASSMIAAKLNDSSPAASGKLR
eukprot:CAMPEP_0180504286 /NCGR_PEP_ID=MMETSP1036_2-20121128/46618_1 /TAXON_ID=632150 /ORGANISM="Azadinium spinosum, Strain 3D9" /LENGTH=31 /DNA_ID= /DNA_START= /DNA_END= /DNA_ORIENTATION=